MAANRKKYLNKDLCDFPLYNVKNFESGALHGKMLLVRIIENSKIDDYLSRGWLSKG